MYRLGYRFGFRGAAGVVAAAALAGGALAAAPDMILSRAHATSLIESDVGQPYWLLLAQCAGVFGATSNYDAEAGHTREAEADKARGVGMLNAAIGRLQIDRGIDRQDALAIASPQVDLGRADGRAMLDTGGTGAQSPWNWARSSCLDIETAYGRGRN